ncbi:MAG: T9SS type A sorting domain-containing protein [bacterium]
MVRRNTHKLLKRNFFFILSLGLLFDFCFLDSIKAGTLSENTGISLTGVYQSSIVWGDIDNDADLDLVLAGFDSNEVRHSKIYKNSGQPQYMEFLQSLTGVSYGSLAWGDYDRDGDLDLALSGQTEAAPGRFTKIYRNDDGVLTDSGVELIPVWAGSLAWGDYDNDGDLDLALTGWNNIVAPYNHSKIYYQDDAGMFVEDTGQNLLGVQRSSIAWADYDNDGDLDIVLTGWAGSNRISKIYKNSGDSAYKLSESQSLTGVEYGSIAWGDYDNDGDLDLALCGYDGTNKRFLIYNNNNGTLENPIEPMGENKGVIYGSLGWGDYDNDGDLDLAICGNDGTNKRFLIYRNDNGTSFTSDHEPMGPDKGVEKGSLAWADLDMDADLDLVLTGHDGSEAVSKIFENDESQSGSNGENSIPSPPTSLACNYSDGKLTLTWSDGSDNAIGSGKKTPSPGLYYNLRIGTEPGADDLVAARYGSPLLGNFLSKNKSGNQNTLTFKVYGKGYYWSVQTIDTTLGFSWSEESTESGWAEEGVFVDTTPPPSPSVPTDDGEATYNTALTFRWTQPEKDPETKIYNYHLHVKESPNETGEPYSLIFDGNVGEVFSKKVSGCKYWKYYFARVQAHSGGGETWSADWSDGIMVVRLLDISNNLIHPRKADDNKAEIKYFIINLTKVTLKIYNLMGELVKVLVDNENRESGDYLEPWSGENEKGSTVASGIYLVHIEVGGATATEKICVVK